MTIDAISCESQFLDHLAPVWRALPYGVRGEFLVDRSLVGRARALGIEPTSIDAEAIRKRPHAAPVFDGIPTLVASIGDVKVGRRIGHGPFAFLEHGCGQSYGRGPAQAVASYAGGPDRDDNALFLVPNEYAAALWRSAYPESETVVVGSPKLDTLPAREPGPDPVVAISFHGDWPHGVPYGGNALPDYASALAGLVGRFSLIGHGHPGKGWGTTLARLYGRIGIEYVPEFADVCRRADVYVCDNSSTIFEFAATGRPVVLLNASHWHKGHGPGGRFWDWAHVGVNVDRQDQLVPAIERALVDPEEDRVAREDALSRVFAYRSGGAKRAATALLEWQRAEVAA